MGALKKAAIVFALGLVFTPVLFWSAVGVARVVVAICWWSPSLGMGIIVGSVLALFTNLRFVDRTFPNYITRLGEWLEEVSM